MLEIETDRLYEGDIVRVITKEEYEEHKLFLNLPNNIHNLAVNSHAGEIGVVTKVHVFRDANGREEVIDYMLSVSNFLLFKRHTLRRIQQPKLKFYKPDGEA